MKKLLLIVLLALPLWANAQTNKTYSQTNIDNMFLTNRITLTSDGSIIITTNNFKSFMLSVAALSATAGTISELTNGAVSHVWQPPDVADVETTNILCTWLIPTNGFYDVHFSEFTFASNVTVIDSISLLYIRWTDLDANSNRVTAIINTGYAPPQTSRTIYPPLSFPCKAGSTIIVSNWSLNSFDAGDNSSTNYVRASIWGRRQ